MNLKNRGNQVHRQCRLPDRARAQTNPWNPGEIVFAWDTGGKAPKRTWTVMADGSGLRPLYPEAPYGDHPRGGHRQGRSGLCHVRKRRLIPGTTRAGPNYGSAGSGNIPRCRGHQPPYTPECGSRTVPSGRGAASDWHVAGSADGRLGLLPTISSMRSGSTTGTTARPPCWPAPRTWARITFTDVQRRRHQDRDPVRPDLQGSKVSEHLRRPAAQERAQSTLQPQVGRLTRGPMVTRPSAKWDNLV